MNPSAIRVGVIGYGYCDPDLVRRFVEERGSELAAVSDMRDGRLDVVRIPGAASSRPEA